MDIKPFVKRVFQAYRSGNKQPIYRREDCLYEEKYYKMTVFEVKQSDIGESFWSELDRAYVGNMKNGQVLRVEKYEQSERVLIALMTPHKEQSNERQAGS